MSDDTDRAPADEPTASRARYAPRTYRVPTHVRTAPVDGEAVLLDMRQNLYLGLNRTGAAVWEVLSRGGSEHEAARDLVRRFETDLDTAAGDVRELVGNLLERGLLVR